MDAALESLPPDLRAALATIAKLRGITEEEALRGALTREVSLDAVRADGWHLLAEKNGELRELADA